MKYNYRYEFHPHGTTASKSDREPSHIWIDNGNTLDEGIFDHHHTSQYCCTVEAIVDNTNFLTCLEADEANTFTFHTHRYPDTDALFSIYLIQNYLEHRDKKKEITACFPQSLTSIVDYVKAVDRGNILLADQPNQPLVSLYCILTFVFMVEKDMQKATERALTVIRQAVRQAEKVAPAAYDFFTSPIERINCRAELKLANEDYQHYLADKSSICKTDKCYLPLGNETISDEKVDVLIWTAVPTCQLNRLWARADGYPLTIIPDAPINSCVGEKQISCTNYIISLNPAYNDNRELPYSLLPIARYLETYEQEHENTLYQETGCHKRDHSAPRGYREESDSLFLTPPYEETSDPWFINADLTLIASPRTGSLLSPEDIIHTVVSFSECKLNSLHNNLIIPFRFERHNYKHLNALFQERALYKNGNNTMPYLRPSLRYFNTMVTEFSLDQNNYAYYIMPVQSKLLKDLQALNDTCAISKELQVFLFPYGIGFFLLSANRDYSERIVPTFLAMETQRNFRMQIDEYFRTTLSVTPALLDPELADDTVKLINPHYYTYAKLSPENAAVTDQSLTRYAAMLCSIDGNTDNNCQTLAFNYRQHMAYSRIGSALVSTTFEEVTPIHQLFNQEWFWMYLLILEQRYVLLECKRVLVETKINNRKSSRIQIKDLREMLISFSSAGYFSTAIEEEVGDRIYRGLSGDIYRISELKEEVLNQLDQVANYHDSKVTASLDKISLWILPFMVLSTILQCSLITMEPLVGVSEKGFPFSLSTNLQAFASWGIMVLLVALLFIILKITDRRK